MLPIAGAALTTPGAFPHLSSPARFRDHLANFLEAVRIRWDAHAIGIAAAWAPEGRVVPTWVCVVGERGVVASIPAPPELAGAGLAGLRGFGPPFDAAHVEVVPLSVVPAVHHAGDAVAVIAAAELPPREDLSRFVDAVSRAMSDERRRQLAELLLAALESGPDPVEITDRGAQLVYANPAWERTFGHARSGVVGRTVGQVFRDPVQPLHDEAFYRFTTSTLAEGRPWIGSLACRTADGARVFTEVAVHPFEAAGEGFRGNFALRRDLGHRNRRDEALAVAHHEIRNVLTAIPDGVAVLREGRVYFANAPLLAMLRREPGAVIGRRYRDLVHPEDRAELERVLATPGPDPVSCRIPTPEGPRIAEITVAGSVSFEGSPSTIVLSRDATDLRIAKEQLARADRLSALGSLAAGVAHEINNPLAYVLLNLTAVRAGLGEGVEAGIRDAVDEAIGGVLRIQGIVGEVRGFSTADAGPPQEVDLAMALRAALNITQNELRHRARLDLDLAPVHALGREGPLVQLFVNLLVNAAQAIPEGSHGEIRVRTGRGVTPNGCPGACAVVEDTGSGIDPSFLPHVFDPFVTGRSGRGGTGLGLTISKRIVESFGGRIGIASTIGEGTRVTVMFPRVAPPEAPVPTPRATPESAQGLRRRVLVVDDEEAIARALQRVLSKHEVVVVHDGARALDALARGGFDVVLCDLMMPGISGADLYRRACAEHPALADRFVFMTGGAFTDGASSFLASVPCRVLTKPFDPADVLRCVLEVSPPR